MAEGGAKREKGKKTKGKPAEGSWDFLEKLMRTDSPTGFEQPAQRAIEEFARQHADRVDRDVHGNLMAVLNPGAEMRVMLAGHCDEIGLMVSFIDEQGFLFVNAIGGVDPTMYVGSRVRVLGKKGPVLGVLGRRPIHTLPAEERGKPIKVTDLWIDIGASSADDAREHVAVGDPAVIEGSFARLLNETVVARGFDDRIGAFVVMEALKLLRPRRDKLKVSVYAVSTVQEEVGLRGARTSAFSIDPQVGIAVDVGFATDYPGENKREFGDIKLGKGPILNRGSNINPVLADMMEKTAEKKKIPFQMQAAPNSTGTDANAMQISRGGVATALVSIPNRYMHSAIEVVSLRDVSAAAMLLAETILAIEPGISFVPA